MARDDLFRCGRGFTIVELVVVIIVLGILASLAAPRFAGRSAFDERGYFDQVRTSLRYAQKSAVAMRREVCVTFTAASVTLSYNPTVVPGAACAVAVSQPGSADPYAIPAPAGVALAFPNAVFRFNGLGQPVDNATGAALPLQTITVTGTSARALTVQAETGYVF